MGTKRDPKPPPEAAAPKAIEKSAGQSYMDTRNLNLLQGLDSGTDVRNIKELSPNLQLLDSAKKQSQNYAGEGLLSTNALSGGNSGQLGLIAQQIQARRAQEAEGDLYNGVQNARGAAEAGLQWGANLDVNREGGNADRQNQRYTAWLNRPKQPSLLSQILSGGLQAAGTLAGAAM